MRLLAVSDDRDKLLETRLERGRIAKPDLIISCGDLHPSYLDYVATLANAPLYYVRGNHDTDERGYGSAGGTDLDCRVVDAGGLRIAGLSGSLDYREGIVGFSEGEMRMRALRVAALAKLMGGIDVLVTHAPPRGYGDLDDRPHRGFECFNWLLRTLRPKLLLHGHVHLDYGIVPREQEHPCGTRIVNAFRFWEGELG